MLKQINIIVVISILLFSIGCTENTPTRFSDCENIKNKQERDSCFVKLIEISAVNNTDENIKACNMISDVEIRDLCLFKVSRDSWRTMSADTLRSLCSNISSEPLRNSCNDILNRPHLQVIE